MNKPNLCLLCLSKTEIALFEIEEILIRLCAKGQFSYVVSGSVPKVKIYPCIFLLNSICRP